jgi:hypothetical protein
MVLVIAVMVSARHSGAAKVLPGSNSKQRQFGAKPLR